MFLGCARVVGALDATDGADATDALDAPVDAPTRDARPDRVVARDVEVPSADKPILPLESGFGLGCSTFSDAPCPGQQRCLFDGTTVGRGFCARQCFPGGAACGSSQRCVAQPERPGVCLPRCTSNEDCPGRFLCETPPGSTDVPVCVPFAMHRAQRADGGSCYTTAPGPHVLPALARSAFTDDAVSLSSGRADSLFEAEGNFAIDPATGALAGTYSMSNFDGVRPGVSSSRDGRTWSREATVREPELPSASDPVLDWSGDGALRMIFVGYDLNSDGSSRGTVRVSESRDGGARWTVPASIEPAGTCARSLCDKPWILSFPRADAPGRWRTLAGYLASGSIVVQRSDDGVAWGPTLALAARGSEGTQPMNLLHVDASADGSLLGAAWVVAAADPSQAPGSVFHRVRMRTSPDGGVTWTLPVTVSAPNESVVYQQPWVAVDGRTLHVLYVRGDATLAWDLMLATSVDGGETWRYRKVNDEPDACATHAFATLAVDPATHDAHAVWLENRFGDGAVAHGRCPADPSTPCAANDLVSGAAFRFTVARTPAAWHGDYNGLAFAPDGSLWSTWSDTREGSPHMYAARARPR